MAAPRPLVPPSPGESALMDDNMFAWALLCLASYWAGLAYAYWRYRKL